MTRSFGRCTISLEDASLALISQSKSFERATGSQFTFKSAAGLACVATVGKLEALTVEGPEVTSFLSERRIEWRFNLAKASWWGGFFERMVKSTKRCLKKQLGNAKLRFEELMTVLTEVKAVLNSRPLTYTSRRMPIVPRTFTSRAIKIRGQ